MSKFIKNLSLFLAGLPLLASKPAAAAAPAENIDSALDDLKAVSLRPLNLLTENRFAGHGSHSSHSSHASHYSSSGGGSAYVAPRTPVVPDYPAQTPTTVPTPNSAAGLAASGARSPIEQKTLPPGTTGNNAPVELSNSEKLKLQIMRVQIKLHTLGLYDGPMDGIRNLKTIEALKNFQTVKGLPKDGMMSTPTLNALGIMAVN